MKKISIFAGLIIVIMCLGLLTACGGKSDPVAEAKAKESEFLLG